MDAKTKRELLSQLKNEFDDYIDYFDLMECIPEISEGKIKSLKQYRCQNGLVRFSHYTNKTNNRGVLLVSASKFKAWYKNNFKPLEEE